MAAMPIRTAYQQTLKAAHQQSLGGYAKSLANLKKKITMFLNNIVFFVMFSVFERHIYSKGIYDVCFIKLISNYVT